MKIAIDARWIFQQISGIPAYTRELISHLRAVDSTNSYVLIFSDAALRERTMQETGAAASPNFEARMVTAGPFSPLSQLLLPVWLRRHRVDVYHTTNYMMPLAGFPRDRRGRVACVATIHDVIPMVFPQHAPKSRKARLYPIYRRLMYEIGRRADVIITDSRASRDDIVRHLRIPDSAAGKVRPVYLGASERFLTAPRREPPGQSPARERLLLYVGRFDPYKNLATLVHALAKLRKACGFPVTLLLVGAPDPRYPETERLSRELGVADAIRWTGYLSEEELVEAYRSADVLVHPSRYEGFGLQIVEAMTVGLPVVCSNGGSLPEVAGDAAVMLDPDDCDGFADSIAAILRDDSLSAELARKGARQAAKFTWRRTAMDTLAIYEGIGGNAG